MEIPMGTQGCFSKSLLLSASILVLWMLQGSQAALYIQKIPEQPQKNQDLLLSVQGVPDTFQDFNWYLGEETYGGTRLFTYIPGIQRPQRDGSAMGQRDIVGFPNGSMLLRRAQPTDSGTYQVAITINSEWTMKAKTEVQVAEKNKELPSTHLPTNAGILAATIIGSLAAGALLISCIAYLLVTRNWRGQSHRMATTEKPELGPAHDAGDNNIYEVMPSPVLLVSPISDTRSINPAREKRLEGNSTTEAAFVSGVWRLPLPTPPHLQAEPENHQYQQDLLNPDPAPYCQLVPTS
uniref:Carcinoembryonic antigen-related cell adhesion molecule 19 isoform 10 transcript variant 14 n=1 Tax=Homo sapiens TaxID=9606 RepID=A0A158VVC9_HUMAN|nr:carcinoembryonic antigen-related cell adhesion molecule 19 isoform 10 transcript variant 14 [Homo sapiens]